MKNNIVAILVLLSLVLSACDTNAGTVKLTVNETAAEISEVTDETIRLNNCGGKADTEQTVERSKDIHIEGSGTLGVDGQVVKGEVSAKYGEVVGYSKSQKLIAPPGTNMEFVLRWTEKTWVGFVSAQGKDEQASYKVSVPISVELISSTDLGNCPGGTVPATIPPSDNLSNSSNDPRDIAAQALGYKDVDEFLTAYGIPPEIKSRVGVCPQETTWCLMVFEEQGQPDFHLTNITKCVLDGKLSTGESGIPVGFDGLVKGFTIRPCTR